jgi:molybdopterin-guanine dinucleotide biosynthesis protein A
VSNRQPDRSAAAQATATGPIGVVLAGGLGRRIGGSKAIVELGHRPLVSYPVEAVWKALGNVAIVAKFDTELPSMPGAVVWIEAQEPRHPLTGIVHALGLAEGRPVVVCAADMPLVTTELIREIAGTEPRGAPAVVASVDGELQPLLGCYQRSALDPLRAAAARDPAIALRDAVAALHPRLYEVEDPACVFNVNSPVDLLQAAGILDRRRAGRPGYPNVKS